MVVTLFKYDRPSVYMRDWFQKPLEFPKSADALVPYIKWYSTCI